jgi:hypothetical protein
MYRSCRNLCFVVLPMTFFRSGEECESIISNLKPWPAQRYSLIDDNSRDDSENHQGLAFKIVKLMKDGKPKALSRQIQAVENRYLSFVEHAKKNNPHGNWFLFAKEVKTLFPKHDHQPLFKRMIIDSRFEYILEPYAGSSRYKVRLRQESDKCR